jgi:ubiquinone/menaquinone biosynthesis C-methylase UbiE
LDVAGGAVERPTPLAGLTYDAKLASVYDEGQAMDPETRRLWVARFLHHAGPARPQRVLDLGCGTGAFTPDLADAFGGPVFAVEPSADMRSIAERTRPHPRVTYLDGCAERIPLPDRSCDFVLMYLVLQHVADKASTVREVFRVLNPAGRLLVAGRFRGEPTPRAWSPYFPRADAIEQQSLPTIKEAKAVLGEGGLVFMAQERVRFVVCGSLRTYVERVRLRAVSAFRYLSDEEFAAGIAALEAAAEEDGGARPVEQEADLLVFRRP